MGECQQKCSLDKLSLECDLRLSDSPDLKDKNQMVRMVKWSMRSQVIQQREEYLLGLATD